MSHSLDRARHLSGRFVESIGARGAGPGDLVWVQLILTDKEFAAWSTMGRADRTESLSVARRVAERLGPDVGDVYLAAALLHDVGKTESGLGTVGRVRATIVSAVVSHGRARHWSNRTGRYLNHDELGEQLLAGAGARPEVVAWAGAHHRPDRWPATGIPAEICAALAEADGEPVGN